MTERGQQAVADWVVIGDGSRYEFLRWILGEKDIDVLRKLTIWLQYGSQYSQRTDGETCWLKCRRILPGTSCYFPNFLDEDCSLKFKVNTVSKTRFLVFEEFPFQKEETVQWIDNIRREKGVDASIVVVLVDLPRRYGSTDIEHFDSQERIDIVRSHYEQAERLPVTVIVARSQSDVIPILSWRESLGRKWFRKAIKELLELKERVADFEFDYKETCFELELGNAFLSLDTKQEVFSLSAIERYKKPTLWENYTEAILAKAFPSKRLSGLFPTVDLYCEVFDNSPLAVWDKTEDRETCILELKNALREKLMMNQGLYQIPSTSLPSPFVGGGEPEHELWDLVKEFVEADIPMILKHRLSEKYKKLEVTLV